MTPFEKGACAYFMILVGLLVFALMFGGCGYSISELSDSSGCLYSTGGPAPGMPSGIIVVCRSGMDKARVTYKDQDGRTITIEHTP